MKKQNQHKFKGFTTNAIHQSDFVDAQRAHLMPIYASSTYFYEQAEDGKALFSGEKKGFLYGRFGNPTNASVEAIIAQLEGLGAGDGGRRMPLRAILHGSGMAAIHTALMSNLKQGDKILTHYSLYGGTSVLMDTYLPDLGIDTVIDSLKDLNKVEDLIRKDTRIKVIYIETPANPTMDCVDLEGLVQIAQKYHLKTICDNTFNTPYIQQPFRFGVDFVVHSTTKFLNGHGTSIGGVLLGKDLHLMNQKAQKTYNLTGPVASPFDAFLLSNGIKTLELRMKAHCDNAETLAHYFKSHPKISEVTYLGFTDNPHYELASKQMTRFGSMMTISLKGGYDACIKLMNHLELCVLAVSLGTCDTLVCHPFSTTHLAVPDAQKKQYGIKENQLRINVGIENIEDLCTEFETALQKL